MKLVLRWLLAICVTLLGCWFYVASTLIGGGMHLDPMPGVGMLIAGVALAAIIGGYWLIHAEKQERILAGLVNVALALGAFSLFSGVFRWGYETIYKVQITEWGHSRPGELLFRISYGTLSVVGIGVFNHWVRTPRTSSER